MSLEYYKQLKSKLEHILDISIFSQLLELDFEDKRETSATILYGFIGRAEKIVHEMHRAHARSDLPSLMSSCDYLRKEATTLGFYKLREICERIHGASKSKEDCVGVFASGKDLCLRFVGDDIASLEDNVTLSRTALDLFYDAL
ncbi:hypothetical protein PMG11_11142 [Penicillium brasilianum]|uniref:HPt domain-containing protein n=1 Tax=Penicillium brasilianum TaxID=104259 RepID=A0A0F7U1A7_PENBI|nr:hypothetical protein PMG11_11142 [Penicillium brasilianum]